MKIYTKTGDGGTTLVAGGERVPKDDRRIEAYGTLDELNAHLGMLAIMLDGHDSKARLSALQSAIIEGCGLLCGKADSRLYKDRKTAASVRMADLTATLEADIDSMSRGLPPLKGFIIPGGNMRSAQAHVARAVCRRAERRLVAASDDSFGFTALQIMLNRMSDYLFTLARVLCSTEGCDETVITIEK